MDNDGFPILNLLLLYRLNVLLIDDNDDDDDEYPCEFTLLL